MQRRALVTGGAGFLGGHLVDRLGAEDWSVRVLDLAEPVAAPWTDWVAADVRDGDAMNAAAGGVDVVFHLGAVVGVERLLEDPVDNIDVTVNGTRNALLAAERAGASLVHVSTSEVLGRNPKLPWDEDAERVLGSALTDRWAYASGKAAAEHVVLSGSERRSVAASVIRPFNVYGPRQEPRFVVARMVRAAVTGEPLEVHDEGSQTRCFTYVDDVVDALVAASRTPPGARLLHIGSTEEVSVLELAELVANLCGVPLDLKQVRPSDRWGGSYEDMDRRIPDTSRAAAVLGWRSTTALEDGLRSTIAWAESAFGVHEPAVID